MSVIWFGVGLIFGRDIFLGVGFIGESSIWKKTVKKSCMLSMLQYAMFSNSTVPKNYQLQFIYKNQTHGNLANFIS